MFVFGFAGDSIAATTTGLLLRPIQTLETLTPGKGKERGRGKSPLFSSFGYELASAVPGRHL